MQRRRFLGLSLVTLGGVSLADTRPLRAANSGPRADTAVVFVQLGGGASQIETYDPKPEAPAEYRGPTRSIPTAVPGTYFCEWLPRQAAIADQLAVVRSIGHREASHIALHVVETGYFLQSSANTRRGEMPSVGAVVSRTRGGGAGGLPPYVSLPKPFAYSGAHYLGSEFDFFPVDGDPNTADFEIRNLALHDTIDEIRLDERRDLLNRVDTARPEFAATVDARSLGAFRERAFELVTGEKARRAFDLDREDPRTRDRYGRSPFGQRLLLARRLVEAGAPFTVVRMGDWDDHENLVERMGKRCAEYDAGIVALVEDLRERGLAERVLVVAMGEFGRTPRFNQKGGRDHWPAVASVLLAGGGLRMGRVVGASDPRGGSITEAPYPPQSILAMVYRHLGIDPATTFVDHSGRPRYVLEEREPIRELI